ncbi:MAG: hypothetical protein P4M14_01000, partial [Gammaproteobacteria bacterium]|nr:hypothetical protein [Gammaproteobacteria bacterium]
MDSNQTNKNLKWFFLSVVLGVLLLSNWVIGSLCLPFLFKYRPEFHATFEQGAERQLLSMDAIIKRSAPASLSVFVGSSAALNAIDEDAIRGVWKEYRDLSLVPANFGTTGLLAYELLMLRDKLLSPKVKVVVYLYNSFSFSDNFYSTAYTMRWNTAEFVRMADRRILRSTP